MEIQEVRKEVEELYRELVRRKYERAIKKGVSEQALANFIALHEKFLPAFVEKEMKWIEIIEEEEKREEDCHLRRWPAGAKRLIKNSHLWGDGYKLERLGVSDQPYSPGCAPPDHRACDGRPSTSSLARAAYARAVPFSAQSGPVTRRKFR